MAKSTKENIYNLKGFKSVLGFTLGQMFKSKAYLISWIFMIVFMCAIGPIQMLSSSKGMDAGSSLSSSEIKTEQLDKINGLVLFNGTPIEMSYDDVVKSLDSRLENIYLSVVDNANDFDMAVSDFENSVSLSDSFGDEVTPADTLVRVYIGIDMETNSFTINGVVSDNSLISDASLEEITNSIETCFNEARYTSTGISKEDLESVMSGFNTKDAVTDTEYHDALNDKYSEDEIYALSYQFVMIMIIVVSLSISYIITAVMEEKTSKLAETILVSVRPLALIMGKIVSVMIYVFSIVICGCLGSLVTNKICDKYLDAKGPISNIMNFSAIFNHGAIAVVVVLISLICSYLIYAIFAGILGSACAKQEDIQTSTQVVSFVNIIVGFVAMFGPTFFNGTVVRVLSFIPPFSCYLAPVTYMVGQISLLEVIVSLIIQMIVVALLFMLCAKVYRVLILRDNKKAKIKDIVEIARSKGEVSNV